MTGRAAMDGVYSRKEAHKAAMKILGFRHGEAENAALVRTALDAAEELIRNYCNIDGVPAGLENTAARMAAEMARSEAYGSAQALAAVKSVTMGDTNTVFAQAQSEGYAESLLKDYRKQLNRYRKVAF